MQQDTMTTLLARLDRVRSRGPGRWMARCPAHEDRTPSLSIRETEKAILLYCFAGCSFDALCAALGVTPRQLFFGDSGPVDRHAIRQRQRRVRAQQPLRAQQQRAYEHARQLDGLRMDVLREAEKLVASARGLDISRWSEQRCDRELQRLADAYHALEGVCRGSML